MFPASQSHPWTSSALTILELRIHYNFDQYESIYSHTQPHHLTKTKTKTKTKALNFNLNLFLLYKNKLLHHIPKAAIHTLAVCI